MACLVILTGQDEIAGGKATWASIVSSGGELQEVGLEQTRDWKVQKYGQMETDVQQSETNASVSIQENNVSQKI